MTVGERIKKLRLEKNITQDELASKLNISRQSISKWENSINEPDIDTLKELCLIFDCDIEDIIGRVREPSQSKTRPFHILLMVSLGISVFSLFSTIGLIPFMPNRIPIHYDQFLTPDSFGSRYEMFLISLTFLIPFVLSFILYQIDKYITDYDNFKFKKLFKEPSKNIIDGYKCSSSISLGIGALIVSLVVSILNFIFFSVVLENLENYLVNIIYMNLALLYGVLGFFSSRLFNKEINFIFGVRTRFAFSSKEHWNKLNKCQSISAIICSTILYICSIFIEQEVLVFFILLLIISIFPTLIYQSYLKHQMKNQHKK